MNPGTIVVLLIVAAIVALILFSMIRNKKKGKSSCSCGCGSCQNSSLCHSSKNIKE
ncbi:MAG: FeoB-associated Cys-rich membrane protein [Oscillospiraceae bacterium]|nr:FeoB-associated Cys-rich membrane protein [Oscillospiraceae bacterium]